MLWAAKKTHNVALNAEMAKAVAKKFEDRLSNTAYQELLDSSLEIEEDVYDAVDGPLSEVTST